ncbi:MAG: hypothetical protein ACFFB0_15145 [Promethearchaeota archaeon]
MWDHFKEKISIRNNYRKVNEYISVQRYESESKIIIYVKNEPLITIPSQRFPSLEYILRGINENLVRHKNPLKNNKTEKLFEKLLLSLENWSKNDYDIHLLHYEIAFPLLKKLKEIGSTKFQIIFQQEILKMYSIDSSEIKDYLRQEGYLNLIGDFF